MSDRLPKSLQKVAAEIRALKAEIHQLREGLDGAMARSRRTEEAHRRGVSGVYPIPVERSQDDAG